jgi:hypothetical protein
VVVVTVTAATVRDRRQGQRWLLVAAVALALAWVIAPTVTPIYDGVGQPDEPYRWVKPPSNAKTTKAPTAAQATVAVTGGFSTAQFANTSEVAPQISLYLPPKALQVPTGATSIAVEVKPLAPTAPLPKDGTIVTNVYHLTATAGGQSVQVIGTGPSEPSLQMRAPTAQQPGPVFEHRTATGWQRVRTLRVGVDIYQAQAPVLGDWALVRLSTSAGGGGINWGLLAGGIAVLAVAIFVMVIRLARTSSGKS